ncbi:MAG: DUF429 domain-containing protein, partial [Bdellovibrionota bacterium]
DQLIAFVNQLEPAIVGIDAPLTLPPCIDCTLVCPTVRLCEVPAVRWMREEAKRWGKGRFATPYTQRPVDYLLRGKWQDEAVVPFPTDESFGSSRAPLAARMRYLKRHIESEQLLEVNPRLALSALAEQFDFSSRELRRSRDVEDGLENRFTLLDKLSAPPRCEEVPHLFLYNSEISQLSQEISAFDALLCAWMAAYEGLGLLEQSEFDPEWGRVAKPRKLQKIGPRKTQWQEP